MDSLVEYYSQRAPEYEEIYQREEARRKSELVGIEQVLRTTLAGRRVLEVACGTGYWTRIIAEVAERVVAIDASQAMLEIARGHLASFGNVQLELADAYHLENLPGSFDAGLAMFWFSHIPRARLQEFLANFHRKLGHGAKIVVADNVYLPGVGGQLVAGNGSEDSFKLRKLKDGSTHRIIKNYYTDLELRNVLSAAAGTKLEVVFGQAYWWVDYVVRG